MGTPLITRAFLLIAISKKAAHFSVFVKHYLKNSYKKLDPTITVRSSFSYLNDIGASATGAFPFLVSKIPSHPPGKRFVSCGDFAKEFLLFLFVLVNAHKQHQNSNHKLTNYIPVQTQNLTV